MPSPLDRGSSKRLTWSNVDDATVPLFIADVLTGQVDWGKNGMPIKGDPLDGDPASLLMPATS